MLLVSATVLHTDCYSSLCEEKETDKHLFTEKNRERKKNRLAELELQYLRCVRRMTGYFSCQLRSDVLVVANTSRSCNNIK